MKKFRELSEAIKDKYDIGEYDQEGDMAKSDLRSIIANSKRVHDMLKDDDNLPEWVQSKITKAEDYMSTVANYLEAEMNEEAGASKKKEEKFHMDLDKLVHKTFGHSPAEKKEKMNEAVKMPKQTRAEKEYRRITGKTVDQRLSELDKVQKDLEKQKQDYIKQGIIKAEEVEIEEGIGGTIAGGIGQFIGNKIDPLHGEIMRAHGEVAGRAAEYTIRKHLHKLHSALKKHLSSGTVSEEVELDEGYGAFKLGPGVGRFSSRGRAPYQGLTDPRTNLPLGFSNPPKKDEPKKDEPEKVKEEVELQELSKELLARYKEKAEKSRNRELGYLRQSKEREKILAHANKYRNRRIGLSRVEDRLKKEEVEQIDEISAEVSKRVAQARDKSAENYKLTPTQSRRLGMGDKGGEPDLNAAKALKSAMKRGAKNVYGEEVEQLDEKNAPTNPELWSRAKAMAKAKFDVYPSAYANGWAAKWYKSKGGGWKSVNEEKEKDDLPFTPDKPKKKSVVVGKKPEGYSVARQLARQAMQRYTKPVKEEKDMSKKAKIVKDVIKKTSDEKFNADPMISQSVIRNN